MPRFVAETDPKTEVYANEIGHVVVSQPDEVCPNCVSDESMFVHFSPARARAIAAAMIRAADEIMAESK